MLSQGFGGIRKYSELSEQAQAAVLRSEKCDGQSSKKTGIHSKEGSETFH